MSFLESVPDVTKKLKEPSTADRKFEDVVKSAQVATVPVLVDWDTDCTNFHEGRVQFVLIREIRVKSFRVRLVSSLAPPNQTRFTVRSGPCRTLPLEVMLISATNSSAVGTL